MNAQSALTTNPFITWTVGHMAPRMKRLVYLSSLAAIISETQTLDKDVAIKLNKILHLSNTGTSAMQLPVQLSNVIWANRSILKDELNSLRQSRLNSVCAYDSIKQIVSLTPDWIKYDDEFVMLRDISAIFCMDKEIDFEGSSEEIMRVLDRRGQSKLAV